MFLLYFFTFLLGCCVGSFLNVCIYRMPRGISLASPASHCTACNQIIRWFDNIPLASYLILGGRCRACGCVYSPRYFLVELVTGALFCTMLWRVTATETALPFEMLLPYTALSAALVVTIFVDIERQIIPDEVTMPGIFAGVLVSVLLPQTAALDDPVVQSVLSQWQIVSPGLSGLVASILGAVIGGGAIWFAGFLGRIIFRKEAMGGGDVKLMAAIGAFIGPRAVLLAILAACLYGSIIGIYTLVRRRSSRIPFGPYLALGTFTMMLAADGVFTLLRRWADFVQGITAKVVS